MACLQDYFDSVWVVRLLVQRGLAALYLVAFVSSLRQFCPLLGDRGLLPVRDFLAAVPFRRSPSLFYWRYSDALAKGVCWAGIALSLCALLGISESGSIWLSAGVWLCLWLLYLSVVNVGQTFYAFGWESMLLEGGFFAIFLGPARLEPSLVPVLALRWMLFRVELGAGLIKIRHDECWRNLTCLYYHHETQPLPNPLSWYAHRLPKTVHRLGVVFSHFVQLVAPFGLLFPQPIASVAGAFIIAHQLLLVISGNYAWLNWLTIVLGVTAFSDSTLLGVLPITVPETAPRSGLHDLVMLLLGVATVALSVKPVLNLFSKNQLMNYSYNSLHIVNTYGAFGSVSRVRDEIVLEGASATDEDGGPRDWREYEFKAKPGDPRRMPPQVAPYHLRLDWLMWFLPLRTVQVGGRVLVPRYERWFLRLVEKLLSGDRAILGLLRKNPFPDGPPAWIRARIVRYQFSDRKTRRRTGTWWERRAIGEFLGPVELADMGSSRPVRPRARPVRTPTA